MTKLDRVKLRAQARERRRFRSMIAGGSCAYGLPAVTLYVEAMDLVQTLLERAVREMTEPEMDALHEATHAELDEMAAGITLPDIPLAMTETEARWAWGNR